MIHNNDCIVDIKGSRDDKSLSMKIEKETRSFDILKNFFLKIADSESTLKEKRIQSFNSIATITDTDNKYLQDINKKFCEDMKSLEESRKKHLTKINEKLLPATVYYPEKIKSYKTKIVNMQNLNQQKLKQKNELDRAVTKNDRAKEAAINAAILQSNDKEVVEANNLEKGVVQYESERVVDIKYLLLNFIHSELSYHAKALEKLSELYGFIAYHEPKELLDVFMNKYGINPSTNLQALGVEEIKKGETDRRKAIYEEKLKEKDGGFGLSSSKNQQVQIGGNNSNVNVSPAQGSRKMKDKLDHDENLDMHDDAVSTNQQLGIGGNMKLIAGNPNGKTMTSSAMK